MTFKSLGIDERISRAISELGYSSPTPIQQSAIPPAIAGRDLLGCAQTGTGKTAAFAIPLLHRVLQEKRVAAKPDPRTKAKAWKLLGLVLAPTRELAAQIGASFTKYGKHTGVRTCVIYGGVNQNPQARELQQGVDVLVATPGRLLDLMNQGFVQLSDIKSVVLDEADHMLDMGFLPDVKRILGKLPKERQNLLFSATMPTEIAALAKQILRDPVRIQIDPHLPAVETVEQSLYYVAQKNKPLLLAHVIRARRNSSTIVFTRTKHGANAVVRKLESMGITSLAIHGNKSQSARQKALDAFKQHELHVLVATDIAARGIDVQGVAQVINFDLPQVPETYVHRIGRTGRAGRRGHAISFCGPHETEQLLAIEQILRKRIPVGVNQPPDTALTDQDRQVAKAASRQGTSGRTSQSRTSPQTKSQDQRVVTKRATSSRANSADPAPTPKPHSTAKGGRASDSQDVKSSKRPDYMRAKKAKAPSKRELLESFKIRKNRTKPKPKSNP